MNITLTVDANIQGQEREDLWHVCCSSFPVIVMSDGSDIDCDKWRVERADEASADSYREERETLRDCIYNLGYLIEGFDTNEWAVQ